MNLRMLYYRLPPQLRFIVRRLYYAPQDLMDAFGKKRDPELPPKGMIYTGGGDFKQAGRQWVDRFVALCHIKADYAVLDIGSGIGRVAIPLTRFLNKDGRYEGFDVVKKGIRWCQKKITSKYPHFRFTYIPLKNDLYRSDGQDASSFVFPYPDESFDFIFLTSVFTHMIPSEVENYMHEIFRVLKPGRRCLATFFILNDDNQAKMVDKADFQFPHNYGTHALMDDKVRSANVAYDEQYLNTMLQQVGFEVEHVIYGFWGGRAKTGKNDFQDMVVIRKPG